MSMDRYIEFTRETETHRYIFSFPLFKTKRISIGMSRYDKVNDDYCGWFGPYDCAPLNTEEKDFCDKILKLSIFW